MKAHLGHRGVREELEVLAAGAAGVPGDMPAGLMVQHVSDGHERDAAAPLCTCSLKGISAQARRLTICRLCVPFGTLRLFAADHSISLHNCGRGGALTRD